VHGQVFDTGGTPPLDGVEVIVTDQNTGDSLSNITSMGGWYSVNLANMGQDTDATHEIEVSATYNGKADSESFIRGPVSDSPKRVDLMPTPTPTPTPAGIGRGGGGGAYHPPVTTNVPIDPTTGKVTTTTPLTTDKATLTITAGIIVNDEAGKPLSTSITMTSTPATAEKIGAIAAYDFGPSGTTFSEPIDLVITYDPADVPAGAELTIKMYDGTKWVDLPTTVDTVAHTATAKVSHFRIFALFAAAAAPTPTPTPTVTPTIPPVTPTPTPPVVPPAKPWGLIIGIIIAVIIVGAAAYYFYTKKKA